ncbi:hypothetical protein PPL_06341 [Heterostelium album PN500]|uniref:Ankyrin repeat-containing protein n=1 Tax=Heterostelium pallidum (strain ATCC 26659 / Pp 5 / PN500) TaxID=670386 RepID=D3BCW3_HETP5|nr:hypothetical protein PPL_06341 [Heterostelium album PN500]EFA80755.1 hypothetical protein PPL_06341 [Heterostelium album PN500]|eukprot:XP_020432874.1 hypothetical protein PPL_06341 [Heterostelium album PN500]
MGKRDSIRYNLLTSTLFTQLQNSIKGSGGGAIGGSSSSSSSSSNSASSSKSSSKSSSVNNSTESMMSCIKQSPSTTSTHNEQTPDSFYLGNQSPDDQRTADTYQCRVLTVAFFKVFTNQSLVNEITKHLLTKRSILSDSISYRPLQYLKYHQIISAEWIITNGYIGLLVDKLNGNRTLVFNQRSITLLAGKCLDANVFHRLLTTKSDYFSGSFPVMVDAALEYGNIEILRYLVEEQNCVLPPNALEISVRYGHLETMKFLLAKRKADKLPLASNSIPTLFKLALTYRHLPIAQYLFEKVGFFLSGPMEDLFRLLCCGLRDFPTGIYIMFTQRILSLFVGFVGLLEFTDQS